VRERFGLSLPEAKELWLQNAGSSDSLDAHQAKLLSPLVDALKSHDL